MTLRFLTCTTRWTVVLLSKTENTKRTRHVGEMGFGLGTVQFALETSTWKYQVNSWFYGPGIQRRG